MSIQLAVVTPEPVTVTSYVTTSTLRTFTTGILLVHFFNSDAYVFKREADTVNQLSVTPERVCFLVHVSRPMRIQYVS